MEKTQKNSMEKYYKYKVGSRCRIFNFKDVDAEFDATTRLIPEINGVNVEIVGIDDDCHFTYRCKVLSKLTEYQKIAFNIEKDGYFYQWLEEKELLPCRKNKLKRILDI